MEPGASCMPSYQLSHVADPPFTSQASIIKPILASLYTYVLIEYVCMCTHAHMCGGLRTTCRIHFSSSTHRMSSRDQTQVVRLGIKCLCQLNHLSILKLRNNWLYTVKEEPSCSGLLLHCIERLLLPQVRTEEPVCSFLGFVLTLAELPHEEGWIISVTQRAAGVEAALSSHSRTDYPVPLAPAQEGFHMLWMTCS